MITEIFILLVLFQIKHFICDYPFQTPYMLQKANLTGWVKPLATHAFVHAAFTTIIVMWFGVIATSQPLLFFILALAMGLANFIIHFTVDRIRASPKLGGRWNPTQPYFWWALGANQMAHHLTHYAFIAIIVSI